MINTHYGNRKQGNSKFVIVAPHAAGDDLRTGKIAEQIAQHLAASFVVNDKYVKPSNSRASAYSHVEDFNKLSWSGQREQYCWTRKHPHMKEFYDHIREFAEHARQHGAGRAVVVYIHGMSDNPQHIGVDIGFGAKYHLGKLKGTKMTRDKHPSAGKNTGVMRAKSGDMLQLKCSLEQRLSQDHSLSVGIGEHYVAWSRQDAIQYHARTPDHSFQLEISSLLRELKNIGYVSKVIAGALREVYQSN